MNRCWSAATGVSEIRVAGFPSMSGAPSIPPEVLITGLASAIVTPEG